MRFIAVMNSRGLFGGHGSRATPAFVALLGVNVLLLSWASWALVSFGSIQRAIGYYFHGTTLFADSPNKSFGIVSAGEPICVKFKLTNHGNTDVRVVGCHAGCNCVASGNRMPFSIKPGENRDFRVSIHNPNPGEAGFTTRPARVKLEITIFTNNAMQPRMPLFVSGVLR